VAGTIIKSLDNSCSDEYLDTMGVPTVAKAGKRFDSPQQEVFLNLWRTYDRLRALEDELFGRFGLTAQQYNALRILRAAYPAKVPTLALATRLVSRAPDITRLLDKLHDRGLIDRERPAANRRTVMVGITEAGLAMIEEIDPHVRDCHVRQLGHLADDEMTTLVKLLNKVRAPHEPAGSTWR
jgi:DNA-binding MarR family transcriptional regulator